MTNNITDALAADIREIDGAHTLSAGSLAEALVAKGWIKKPAPASEPLSAYKYGDKVFVTTKPYGELPGIVNNVDRVGAHIDTERGAFTIQNPLSLRRQ